MDFSELRGVTHQARCGSCGALSTYTQFESSFYDFASYFGETTNTLYRVAISETELKYGVISLAEALRPAIEREHGLEHLLLVPDQLKCRVCRDVAISMAAELGNGFEEMVQAIVLPNHSVRSFPSTRDA